MNRDAKLKLQVFTSVVELPSKAEQLVAAKLVVEAKLNKYLVDAE